MLAKATPSALREPIVDINEANVSELSSILPGIGPILAQRIVSFRDENGPFLDTKDLEKVPGISAKRFSMVAARISIAPGSSLVRMAASNSNGPSASMGTPTGGLSTSSDASAFVGLSRHTPVDEESFFAMSPRVFREPPPPSLSSFMGQAAEESAIGGSLCPLDRDPDMSASSNPPMVSVRLAISTESTPGADEAPISQGPEAQSEGEATRAADVVDESSKRAVSDKPLSRFSESLFEDLATVPLQRSWRAWLAIGALGVFSTVVGTLIGIRSQSGGPRGAVENRIGRVQGQVTDVAISVQDLEVRANGMANSIQVLDERLSAHERKDPHARPAAATPTVNRAATAAGGPQSSAAQPSAENRAESRANESRPSESRSNESRPSESRSNESRPSESRSNDTQHQLRRALQELDLLGASSAGPSHEIGVR